MTITRDVHFHEDEQWDWKDSQNNALIGVQDKSQWNDESIDDSPIRGTRSLANIYQWSNVAVCKPEGYEEAHQDSTW
jgi:hypothetical protein